MNSFAIVIPTAWNVPHRWSVDVDLIVQGFLKCGQDAKIICAQGSDLSAAATDRSRIRIVPLRDMAEVGFWQTLEIEAALIFTWLGRPEVARAAREAGLFVVSLSDSDGLVGVRVYPKSTLERMVYPMRSPIDKLRALWYWSKKAAYLCRREEAEIIKAFEAAHVTTVQMSAAKFHLHQFLAYYGLFDAESKIREIPFPVCDEALQGTVGPKQDHLVAIGRWDDPQKDAQLLARSLECYLKRNPKTCVTLLGRGGEEPFARLRSVCKQVRYAGALPRAEVIAAIQDARTIVFTSRWEGMPIALQEALAMGCSVVGTNIPAIRSVCAAGPFGTVAAKRNPQAVSAALQAEHQAWQNGQRDPKAIADYWRSRVSQQHTAQMYMNLLQEHRQQQTLCLSSSEPAGNRV